jgi:hypothetical protein
VVTLSPCSPCRPFTASGKPSSLNSRLDLGRVIAQPVLRHGNAVIAQEVLGEMAICVATVLTSATELGSVDALSLA